ncbi:GntR family transcriptional regulator [Thermocatellispora tengchongensis]|uniref:GntR family transcriptional regulator n=2 Tax=Thermocatellispora tengchongensis TaxID=1073253 RepID=A0A840PBL1_9ACTN|nr:GntR family transcriptional regulator [Thermocatellispora tengchongensis]
MSGRLTPGTRLPSTPQLAERHAAAGATVQRALSLLKDEGFVYGHPGKGVYVRDRAPVVVEAAAYLAPSPRGYAYRLLDVAECEPPADIARALELDEGGRAILRRRLLLSDGDPLELSWSYYPLEIAQGSPLTRRAKIPGGAPQALADLGFPQREFEDRISVRQPTTEEQEGLELPDDVPILRQFRVVYSDSRRPVEASILIKGGHLHELRYRQPIAETP